MGVKLKDINKEIGTKYDPEGWNELHNKVVNTNGDLIKNKGYCNWSAGLCVAEIVDAIVRNTCMCMTVSTFIKVTMKINFNLNIQTKITKMINY